MEGPGRPIPDVARELGIHDSALRNWVNKYRSQHPAEEEPLTLSERARLLKPCLAGPYTCLTLESTSTNTTSSQVGTRPVCAARLQVNARTAESSWRTWPQVNARRKLPSVEGARALPNNRASPP
ncbi:transposase [Streptomyces sp. NPDC055085]